MAKELPYFKFEPNQWENGNIQMFTHEEKGVFMDLCSMYWSRLGDLPYKLAVQKICGGNATALDSLYEENIFAIKDGYICIDFLNEQLNEFENTAEINRKNALAGWEKRRKQKEVNEVNATVMRPQCEPNAIREDKRREEKRREEERKEELFNRFWNLYDKKIDRSKCETKFKKLKPEEMEKLFETLPEYLDANSDIQFRKNPLTYLNGKCWNDEIVNIQQRKTEQKINDIFNPKVW